ncbi:MAG: hypothetical protein J0L92_03790 [Deltaproteobacteria bacterium]|nr:hypothetical protein [Deltaproteobacteria bacterium]
MTELRIATSHPLPEPDPDEPLLLAALEARGIAARRVAWDDGREDWARPQAATLLRSTWDYLHRPEAFASWIGSLRGPVANPADVLLENLHKRYLLALRERGVPTVPTSLVLRDEPIDTLPFDGALVVKPAVSAASFRTARFSREQHLEAITFARALATERDVLIQPYLEAVEHSGERALVWIDGEVTHAVRKSPRLSGEKESVALVPVADDERALATKALAPYASRLLYARVDVVRDAHGSPVVMELELLEPSLFLAQHPPALTRFADAIDRWLRASSA